MLLRSRTGSRRAGAVVVVALTALLMAGCAPASTPAPTRTSTHSPDAPRYIATAAMLSAGPLQTVLPELARRAIERGATLVLPDGRFSVTESVVLPEHARLRLGAGTVITGDLPGKPLLRLAARSSLAGGALHNTSSAPGFDLDLAQDAQHVEISGVTFRGASSNSLYIASTGISDVRITGNRFEQVGYGVLLNPPANDARSITIGGNTFADACADAVEINAATGGGGQRVRDVDVSGNRISGSCGSGPDSGLSIGMAGVDGFRIVGNTVLDARNEAVHLEDGTTNGTVQSNRISGGGHGDRPAIAIYRTTSTIRVVQNSITEFSGGGIGVRWDSFGSARSVSVLSNRLRGIEGDGIVVSGGGGTGPFIVEQNSLAAIDGRGIAVIGPHEQSTVEGNILRSITGQAIAQELRGNGQTLILTNSVD